MENNELGLLALNDNELLTIAFVWNEFNSYDGSLYVNHNFTFANSVGTTLRESYVIGSYVTPVGTTTSGVIFTTGYIMSLSETESTHSSAKSWCSSYGDGKWHLPNLNELYTIHSNKSKLNATLSKVGGTVLGGSYWSSNEFTSTSGSYSYSMAYYVNFSDGKTDDNNTWKTYLVRAVRAL